MKKCSRCLIELENERFHRNISKKDGLSRICKECQRLYLKEHYATNKVYYKNKAGNHGKLMKQLIREQKDRPCLDCGVSYPYYVMDFDHVRGEKSFNLSEVVKGAQSKKVILEEIDKCEVVCSNCHRIRTYGSVV